jgi:hypothetical protein
MKKVMLVEEVMFAARSAVPRVSKVKAASHRSIQWIVGVNIQPGIFIVEQTTHIELPSNSACGNVWRIVDEEAEASPAPD